jgi:hypothetical protein
MPRYLKRVSLTERDRERAAAEAATSHEDSQAVRRSLSRRCDLALHNLSVLWHELQDVTEQLSREDVCASPGYNVHEVLWAAEVYLEAAVGAVARSAGLVVVPLPGEEPEAEPEADEETDPTKRPLKKLPMRPLVTLCDRPREPPSG